MQLHAIFGLKKHLLKRPAEFGARRDQVAVRVINLAMFEPSEHDEIYARRSLIALRISATASVLGFAPRLPLP